MTLLIIIIPLHNLRILARSLIKCFEEKKRNNIVFSRFKNQAFRLSVTLDLTLVKFVKTRIISFISIIIRKVIIRINNLN